MKSLCYSCVVGDRYMGRTINKQEMGIGDEGV